MFSTKMAKVLKIDACNWREKASRELNDDPREYGAKIDSFKQKIQKFSSKHKNFRPRLDDEFLMLFLRSRKFDIKKAFDAYEKYFRVRLCNSKALLPIGKGPRDYIRVLEKPLGTLMKQLNPIDGTIVVIWSFKNFDISEDDMADMMNVTLFINLALKHPAFQTYGARVVFDMTGLRLSMISFLMARFYNIKALINVQSCIPTRLKGIHMVNEYFGIGRKIYGFVRPFMSEKMHKRVHFHGSDLDDLHSYISPKALPMELGGTQGPIDANWLIQPFLEMHDDCVKESYYGFVDI